jgi:hypothetical protein
VGGVDGRYDDPVRRADVATAAQWALDRKALLDPMMAGTSQVFGGISF